MHPISSKIWKNHNLPMMIRNFTDFKRRLRWVKSFLPNLHKSWLENFSTILFVNYVSYPNFVRGLLFDDIQPLIGRFETLGVLCCTICEVPRYARNQKEAGLRDPWNSVMWRKSKRGVFAQSVSFRNFFES